jgi:hypothetical protein
MFVAGFPSIWIKTGRCTADVRVDEVGMASD